jgi:hypothetical protein
LRRLDDAQASEAGQLIRQALDILTMVKIGMSVPLDEIAADELLAMLVIQEERDRFEAEKKTEERDGR